MTVLSRYVKRLAEAERKGLDLSPEGRAQRAKEQGYFTNQDLYNLLSQEPKVEIKKSTIRGNPEDYLDLFVNNNRVEQGRQRDIDRYLNYNSEYFSPASVQRDGLKREAYVKAFPGKYEKGYADFSMDDLFQLYHGTAGDIQSFNPNMLGRTTGAGSAREATFMSNLPEDAEDYAAIANANQPKKNRALEVISEISRKKNDSEKYIELYHKYNMDKYGGDPANIEAAERNIQRMMDRMQRVAPAAEDSYKASYPLVTRMENPMLVDNRGEGYGNITKSIQEAKEKGHDAVVFFDINDPNPHATHIAAFDPSKIRSRFAIFDPDHINSRDLLAGVGGAAALGTELDNLEEPEGYASGGLVRKMLYHGGAPLKKDKSGVTYFTENKDLAESYIDMTNDRFGDIGKLQRAMVDVNNPADQSVVEELARSLGMDFDSGTPASIFDSELHGDYVDSLLSALKERGYDSAILEDIAYGRDIQDKAYISFDPKHFDPVEEFAEGGLVESTKAFGRGALHGGTMAADEPFMALVGSAYAKAMRPELFEDLSYEDLVDVALANQAAERATFEEAHPLAYLAGELASGAIPIAMGGSIPTQMLNSAAMSGLYGFNEAPTFGQGLEDAAIDAGIGAAVPPAFAYGSKALPLLPLLMGADAKKVVFQE